MNTKTNSFGIISRHFAGLRPEIEALFAAQWADPELPAMEFRSSARLTGWLEAHGFDITYSPGEVPTAFVARSGKRQGPVIAILAEYDALPGLGNAATANRQPTTQVAGHGCGHNHIGPADSAAAILAAKFISEASLPGEVRVIGCPAEELLWGKIALLKAGVFAGVDAVLTSHGDYQTGSLSRPCQSVVSGEFVFLGQSGHGGFASASNALAAAEAFVTRAERMRSADFADCKFRHVLRRSGLMPGITPDETRVWYMARNPNFATAQKAFAAIEQLAERTASEMHVALRRQFISETRGYLGNDVIGTLLLDCLNDVGPPQWTNSDLAFMQDLVSSIAPGQAMTLDRGIRYFDQGEDYYGQDDGEISWRVPLGRVNWAYPEEVPIHHWAWTALSGHPSSYPGPLMAAQALALAVVRLLASPEILARAKEELNRRTASLQISEPRLGAVKTLTTNPQSFWDASWSD